jgi:hypothetical protein
MLPLIKLLGEVISLAVFFAAPTGRRPDHEACRDCPERY